MNIAIGSDHGGFELKEKLKTFFETHNYNFKDFGCFSTESVDYPAYAEKTCKALLTENFHGAVLICGTGIGISIAANKIPGIRAALCTSPHMAQMAREHNNANVLCLGGRTTSEELASEIVKTFLETKFQGGRHQNRLDMISNLEQNRTLC